MMWAPGECAINADPIKGTRFSLSIVRLSSGGRQSAPLGKIQIPYERCLKATLCHGPNVEVFAFTPVGPYFRHRDRPRGST